jgi:hypothetical protein
LRAAREQPEGKEQSRSGFVAMKSILGIERLEPVKPDATLDPLPGGIERLFIAYPSETTQLEVFLQRARASKDVEYAEPISATEIDETGTEEVSGVADMDAMFAFPNDPDFPRQWALHNTGTNGGTYVGKAGADLCMIPAWSITTGSRDIVVAFLSSGLHEGFEFSGRVLNLGYNFHSNNKDVKDSYSSLGTMVTSVGAATGNNSYAMAGVDWKCSILPIKIMGDTPLDFTIDMLARGIVYAADKGARVICLGLGNKLDGSAFDDAAAYAASKGAIIIAAKPALSYFNGIYPRAYDHILVIGRLDNRGVSIDTPGPVDFVVPGTMLTSLQGFEDHTRPTNAPHTSALAGGVISLMLSLDSSLTFKQVYDLLKESAVDQSGRPDQDTPGWDPYHGWGRINAYRALRLLQERSKAVPQSFGVSYNYPNPFNSSTIIQYELKYPMHVSINIYNLLGQPVVTLLAEDKEAGYHHARWDAKVSSGVYIYRLQARPLSGSGIGERVIVNKMILAK